MLRTTILKKLVLNCQRIFNVECYKGATKNFMQYHSGGEDYNPPLNVRVLSDFIGNDDKNGVVCLYQDNIERVSKEGEKRFYSTNTDGSEKVAEIYLRNDGKLVIEAKGDVEIITENKVKISADTIETTGSWQHSGNFKASHIEAEDGASGTFTNSVDVVKGLVKKGT